MTKTGKILLIVAACVLLLAMIVGMVLLYIFTRPQPQEGSKEITVVVVHKDGTQKTFTYHTDEEYLDKVLLEHKLIEGYDDQYGFVIESVDGEKASWEEGVFWALYVGENQSTAGVSAVVVEDGAEYRLVYEAFSFE